MERQACRHGVSVCKSCNNWHHSLVKCPSLAPSSQEEADRIQAARVMVNAAVSRRWKPAQMLAQEIEVGDDRKKLNVFRAGTRGPSSAWLPTRRWQITA
jgi:hypothetical protein